jgi:hypothetical protein
MSILFRCICHRLTVYGWLQTLKYLAETFNIPILVTNQVTTKFQSNLPANSKHNGASAIPHQPAAERDSFRDGEAFLTAALGPAWSHCVNTRVVLEQTPLTRLLTVAKSPIAPVTQMDFEITVSSRFYCLHSCFYCLEVSLICLATIPTRMLTSFRQH